MSLLTRDGGGGAPATLRLHARSRVVPLLDARLGHAVDLAALAAALGPAAASYEPQRFPGCSVRLPNHAATGIVFASGSVLVMMHQRSVAEFNAAGPDALVDAQAAALAHLTALAAAHMAAPSPRPSATANFQAVLEAARARCRAARFVGPPAAAMHTALASDATAGADDANGGPPKRLRREGRAAPPSSPG